MSASVVRFVKNLVAAFPRFRPSEDTIRLYTSKLSRWHLTDDQWSGALSRIIAEIQDDTLPTLASIYPFLKTAKAVRHTAGDDVHWLLFDLERKRHAAKCPDPVRPPMLPAGADNRHLAISKPVGYQPCDVAEGKAAYWQVFHEVRGDRVVTPDVTRELYEIVLED